MLGPHRRQGKPSDFEAGPAAVRGLRLRGMTGGSGGSVERPFGSPPARGCHPPDSHIQQRSIWIPTSAGMILFGCSTSTRSQPVLSCLEIAVQRPSSKIPSTGARHNVNLHPARHPGTGLISLCIPQRGQHRRIVYRQPEMPFTAV